MSDTGTAEHARRAGRPQRVPFVVVSDRLPAGGTAVVGLTGLADDPVTGALLRATRRLGGAWIGRPSAGPGRDGGADPAAGPGQGAVAGPGATPAGPVLRTVSLDVDDVAGYDTGHARQTIWPLYHDLVRRPAFDSQWRRAYRRVNQRFAAAAAAAAAEAATVWVHDYHLQLVPAMLRRLRPDLRVGYFLHTSFPPADLFTHMPSHEEILEGILGAHLVGFPTEQGAENFVRLAADLLGHRVGGPADPAADRPTRIEGESPRVAVFPPSVDTAAIEWLAASPDVIRRAAQLRAELADNRAIVLSLDRADESMGTDRRLRALADLFASGRLPADDVSVVQVIVDGSATSSSATSPSGADLRGRVEREVARINGDFASLGHPCVHYVVASPTLAERVALYRAADVLMATPLREATSLPALEYVAARLDTGGALVLSEFSGTAAALPDAHLVNPYDEDQIKAGLLAALAAGFEEHGRRMKQLREYVCGYDANAWAESFLHALRGARTGDGARQPAAARARRVPVSPGARLSSGV